GRASIELEAIGEAPLAHRTLEHRDRRFGVLLLCDDGREDGTAVVVEDAQDVDAPACAVGEADGERPLPVELPALVRMVRLVEVAQLALLAGAQAGDTGECRVRAEVPAQRRAA